LWDQAEKAKLVLNQFKPVFKSKQEYFDKVDRLFRKRVLPEKDYEDRDMQELLIESSGAGSKSMSFKF